MTHSLTNQTEELDFKGTEKALYNWEAWERAQKGERLSFKSKTNFAQSKPVEERGYNPDKALIAERALVAWRHYVNRKRSATTKTGPFLVWPNENHYGRDDELRFLDEDDGFAGKPVEEYRWVKSGTLMFLCLRAYLRYNSAGEFNASKVGIEERLYLKMKDEAIKYSHYFLNPQDAPEQFRDEIHSELAKVVG